MKRGYTWWLRVAMTASVAPRMNIACAMMKLPFKEKPREQTSLLTNSEACVLVADRSRDRHTGTSSVRHMIAVLTKKV